MRSFRLAFTAALLVLASGIMGNGCDCNEPPEPTPPPSQHSSAGAPLAG
jgi:hypothetical protein